MATPTRKVGESQATMVSRVELTEEVERKSVVEVVEQMREINPRMGAVHVVEHEPKNTRSLLGVDSIDVGDEIYLQPPAPFEKKRGRNEARKWFQGTCEPCVGRDDLKRTRKRHLAKANANPTHDASAESLEEIWKESVVDCGCYEIVQIGTLFREEEKCSEWELRNLAVRAPTSLPPELPGITTPKLQRTVSTSRGGWKTNDADLCAIHFLHHQSQARMWFLVHESQGDKLIYLARTLFPALCNECPHFLQHGDTYINPSVLKDAGIDVELLVQSADEFVIFTPGTHYAYFDFGPTLCETMSVPLQAWKPSPESPAFCRCGFHPMWEKGYRGFSNLFNAGPRAPSSVSHWSRSSFSLKDPSIPMKRIVPTAPCPLLEVKEQEKESPVKKKQRSRSRMQQSDDVREILAIPLEEDSTGGVDMPDVSTYQRGLGKRGPKIGDFAAVVGKDPRSGASYFYIGQVLKLSGKDMVTLVWFRKGSDGLFRKENREKWEEHQQSLIPTALAWVSRKKNCKGGTGGHRLVSPTAKQLLGAKFLQRQPRDTL